MCSWAYSVSKVGWFSLVSMVVIPKNRIRSPIESARMIVLKGLSQRRCMKKAPTKVPLIPAIKRARGTFMAPRSIQEAATVRKVSTKRALITPIKSFMGTTWGW